MKSCIIVGFGSMILGVTLLVGLGRRYEVLLKLAKLTFFFFLSLDLIFGFVISLTFAYMGSMLIEQIILSFLESLMNEIIESN